MTKFEPPRLPRFGDPPPAACPRLCRADMIAPQVNADASNVMILLLPTLRRYRFPSVLPLVLTMVLLTVATGALAQERYRTPDEAAAALIAAVRANELQQVTRVLGPGSGEILLSGDPVDDAALRKRLLDAFDAE